MKGIKALLHCIIYLFSGCLYTLPHVDFEPFCSWRPINSLAKKVTCPSAHLLSKQKSCDLAKNNSLSFIHLCNFEADLLNPTPHDALIHGTQNRKKLDNLIEQKILIQDQSPSFYLYSCKEKKTSRRGIIGLMAIKHYKEGTIKIHEATIEKQQQALTQFIKGIQAYFNPVLLTYKTVPELENIMSSVEKSKPVQRFSTSDGCQHSVWAISDSEKIKHIQDAINHISQFYIADGHHRSAAVNMLDQEYHQSENAEWKPHYLVALFADKDISLFEYNRIIKKISDKEKRDLWKFIKKQFTYKQVESGTLAKPQKRGQFGMYLDRSWYLLETRNRKKDLKDNLDATFLSTKIFTPIFHIDPKGASERIEYIGGKQGLDHLEKMCIINQWPLAFLLYPVSAEEFMNIVDSAILMPPKTTWFEPKIRPGLFINRFSDNTKGLLMTKKENLVLVGSHVSIAGGLEKSIERALSIGATTMQIFTKSSRSWSAKNLSDEEIALFKQKLLLSGLQEITAHASYLINIGASDKAVQNKSVKALAVELERCEKLTIPYLVLHPGSHTGGGEESCLELIAQNLDTVFEQVPGSSMICIEAMAGQGTNVGYTFEQLAQIITLCKNKNRLGVCLDTCHMHSAGYDLSTPEGFKKVLDEFSRIVGMKNLKVIHLNDSKTPTGSKKDRHAPLGEGTISLETFKELMNDKRLEKIPKILETPSDEEMKLYKKEIALLRGFVE